MNREDNLSLSTALLIFAHSDKVQSALKPIAYNKQNEALWHKMNERALALVQKLNFLILFPMKVRNKAILWR
jgi:hypothetical protein